MQSRVCSCIHAQISTAGTTGRNAMTKNGDTRSILKLAFDQIPGGLVGWFMELDTDADGYISSTDIFEAFLVMPTGLSAETLLDFVSEVSDKQGRACLSRIW